MRLKTIQRRLRLSMLPDKAIKELFSLMSGIPDQSILPGAKNSRKWSASVIYILTRYDHVYDGGH